MNKKYLSILLIALAFVPAYSFAQAVNGSNTGNPVSGSNTGNPVSGSNTGNPVSGSNTNTPTSPQSTIFTLQNPLKVNSLSDLILTFMTIVSYLAVLFAVLALMYVGFQYVMARGNSEKMKELSNWLLYIVIGLAIILGARIIIGAVIGTLQATGTVNPAIIQNAQNALNSQ